MTNVDERIDSVLRALNAAEVPARLEQRVLARVTQRSAEVSRSRFAGWQALTARLAPYAVGAAVAVVLCAVYAGWVSHRAPGVADQARVRTDVGAPLSRKHEAGVPVRTVRGGVARQDVSSDAVTAPAAADDPDAVALAETMAPSHPAPPMQATPQELMAMRTGPVKHSVEMAELQPPHEAGFRTERERTAIRQYILGLLDPLVTAQNLTSSPPPPVEDPPAPPPTSDATSTN